MKKLNIIRVFSIFLLSVISHFIYEFIPIKLFSIFFPVNESIIEHMKLIITPTLIYSILEYFYYKNKNIKDNNFILSYALSSILGIFIYLLIYIPVDRMIDYNTFFAIGLLFVVFIIIIIIKNIINKQNSIKYQSLIGIVLIIITYITFAYFTYNPIKNHLFYDKQEKIYGIKKEH